MSAKPPRLTRCAVVLFALLSSKVAHAEELLVESERVTLAMIVPALAGSELGELDLGAAPLPGQRTVLRGSDVRKKLKESGRDARGLTIPKSTSLMRSVRTITPEELSARVSQALTARVAPCTVEQLSELPSLSLAGGEFEVEADALPRRESGRTHASLTVRQGERVQRMSLQAVLQCPPPVIQPGAQVRLIVHAGAVHVSAPGVAAQPGRVGDEIRVTNQLTRKSLKARVIDAQSAEVLP